MEYKDRVTADGEGINQLSEIKTLSSFVLFFFLPGILIHVSLGHLSLSRIFQSSPICILCFSYLDTICPASILAPIDQSPVYQWNQSLLVLLLK
jgi:hypothetical protein